MSSPEQQPNRITKVEIMNKKLNKVPSARTKADRTTKDDGMQVSPAIAKQNVTCIPSVTPNREISFDLSKYGFILSRGGNGDVEFYCREFDGFSVELMVSADVYTLSLLDGKSEMVVANRYKAFTQEQLDFIIFNGRVGSWFNVQS